MTITETSAFLEIKSTALFSYPYFTMLYIIQQIKATCMNFSSTKTDIYDTISTNNELFS